MPEGFDLGVSGLASNFDWRALVDRLVDVERTPQLRLRQEQLEIQDRRAAYSSIATQLGVLQNRVEELNDGALFDSRLTTVSDETLGSAAANPGAALGSYVFDVTRRATSSVRRGDEDIGSPLSKNKNVSGVILSDAPLAMAITAGTFTVNGQQVSIELTDSLEDVFDKIDDATKGDVKASYDDNDDVIELEGKGNTEIVLGSATDTSNFLQALRLSNNGTDTVISSAALGSVRLSAAMDESNLATEVKDDGAGAGLFRINGVDISYDVSTDSVSDVLQRINNSTAGVTASYDSVNDRFAITSNVTGDIGISLEEVSGSGNFLTATGLLDSALEHGQDLLYTVNGGGQLSSRSNTITEETSGITGLSVSVLAEGELTVEVRSDSAKIKTAITDFVDEYNKVQALIDTNVASSTDAKGVVTAGTLATESDAFSIAADLRRLVTPTLGSLSGTIRRLESLGITTNGDDNNLAITEATKLDNALAANVGEVKSLFTDETEGLAVALQSYLVKIGGDTGTLADKQDNLDTQVAAIDEQITEQERQVQFSRDRLITSFLAMEEAQLRINQQLDFLNQRFGAAA